jgi:hypothetical protein
VILLLDENTQTLKIQDLMLDEYLVKHTRIAWRKYAGRVALTGEPMVVITCLRIRVLHPSPAEEVYWPWPAYH